MRTCGECKWWSPANYPGLGACLYPVPLWLMRFNAIAPETTEVGQCPCFAPREDILAGFPAVKEEP